MTICIATDSYYPSVGGIATFYRNQAHSLLASGHKVIILTVDYNGSATDEDDVQVEGLLTRVYLRRSFHSIYQQLSQYFRPGGLQSYNWMAMGLAMHDWLLFNHTKLQVDIVEVVDYGGLAYFLCDNQLPPVVITAHGAFTQLQQYNRTPADSHARILSELEMKSFAMADAVIAHSVMNQLELTELTGRKIELVTIPWRLGKGRTTTGAFNNEAVVIGSLASVKGAIVAAEAVRIARANNRAVQLQWIGPDSYTAPGAGLMSVYLAANYPDIWNSSFVWKNALPNEEAIGQLSSARYVVIPSLWESFNQVALEAAAAGKAIIMSDKTGASYLFTHGENCHVVPSGNARALAAAMEELQNDLQRCSALGARAQQRVEELFSGNGAVEERLNVYREALRERKVYPPYEERLQLVGRYTRPHRKLYYRLRALLKKIVKGHGAV